MKALLLSALCLLATLSLPVGANPCQDSDADHCISCLSWWNRIPEVPTYSHSGLDKRMMKKMFETGWSPVPRLKKVKTCKVLKESVCKLPSDKKLRTKIGNEYCTQRCCSNACGRWWRNVQAKQHTLTRDYARCKGGKVLSVLCKSTCDAATCCDNANADQTEDGWESKFNDKCDEWINMKRDGSKLLKYHSIYTSAQFKRCQSTRKPLSAVLLSNMINEAKKNDLLSVLKETTVNWLKTVREKKCETHKDCLKECCFDVTKTCKYWHSERATEAQKNDCVNLKKLEVFKSDASPDKSFTTCCGTKLKKNVKASEKTRLGRLQKMLDSSKKAAHFIAQVNLVKKAAKADQTNVDRALTVLVVNQHGMVAKRIRSHLGALTWALLSHSVAAVNKWEYDTMLGFLEMKIGEEIGRTNSDKRIPNEHVAAWEKAELKGTKCSTVDKLPDMTRMDTQDEKSMSPCQVTRLILDIAVGTSLVKDSKETRKASSFGSLERELPHIYKYLGWLAGGPLALTKHVCKSVEATIDSMVIQEEASVKKNEKLKSITSIGTKVFNTGVTGVGCLASIICLSTGAGAPGAAIASGAASLVVGAATMGGKIAQSVMNTNIWSAQQTQNFLAMVKGMLAAPKESDEMKALKKLSTKLKLKQEKEIGCSERIQHLLRVLAVVPRTKRSFRIHSESTKDEKEFWKLLDAVDFVDERLRLYSQARGLADIEELIDSTTEMVQKATEVARDIEGTFSGDKLEGDADKLVKGLLVEATEQ